MNLRYGEISMGRNKKNGLDYFPFDIDLFQDIRIRKLIKYQSGKAVTVYALLLCIIYKDGYYLRWDKELPFIISEQIGFEEAYVLEVINSCLKLGLFSEKLYTSSGVLTSKGIQERYKKICDLCRRNSEISEYSLISSEGIPISSEEMPINSEESTQSKVKKSKVKKRKGDNIPPTPQDGDVASGKTWRDDFDIYLSEVTEAFEKISSDKEFIKNRQKYHPELDIVLSLKKAFEDYWSQEAGWKRKKISKTKNIDWVSTFKKALDQPQNKVYKQRNVNPEPEQLTPLQERFRKFLEDNGPLLLKMPSQPTDQEVESLAKMNKSMLTDIVRKINNDSYITRYKNSVYQTIMEIKKKEYG